MSVVFDGGYALLIGVDQNQQDALALPAVVRDVTGLHRVLSNPDHCAYAPEHILRVTGAQSTRAGILGGLGWLRDSLDADESGNSTAVVYFSGHGHRDASGYYMLPADVELATLRSSAIAASEFAAALDALRPRRLLVLLDCCHAGGIGAGTRESVTRGPRIKPEAAPLALFMPVVSNRESMSADDAAALGQDRGRTVISSSQGAERSYVRADGTLSIFTFHLIEALIGHAGARRLPGGRAVVSVLDVASYLDGAVPVSALADAGAPQRPSFKVIGMNFPVALVHGGAGYAATSALPDALAAAKGG